MFYLFSIGWYTFLCWRIKGVTMEFVFISQNEEETQKLAFLLGKTLFKGATIALNGSLGAGKTQFAKGIAKSLDVKEEISSPTFNILKCYFSGSMPFYHIDAYRLEDGNNIDIGLEEVINGDGITVVEWPNFIASLLENVLKIDIEILDDNTRKLTFSSNDKEYEKVLSSFKEEL